MGRHLAQIETDEGPFVALVDTSRNVLLTKPARRVDDFDDEDMVNLGMFGLTKGILSKYELVRYDLTSQAAEGVYQAVLDLLSGARLHRHQAENVTQFEEMIEYIAESAQVETAVSDDLLRRARPFYEPDFTNDDIVDAVCSRAYGLRQYSVGETDLAIPVSPVQLQVAGVYLQDKLACMLAVIEAQQTPGWEFLAKLVPIFDERVVGAGACE